MTRPGRESTTSETGRSASLTCTRGRVLDNHEVARGLFLMRLALPLAWGPVAPGQYVSITIEPPWDDTRTGDGGVALLRRPFSVAGFGTAAGERFLELLYACVGKVTRRIIHLGPGDIVDVLGPSGTAFPLNAGAHPLLVGGGRGIAPLLLLARELRAAGETPTLVYGARTRAEWAPLGELEAIAHLAAEDGSGGVHGTVIDVLEGLEAGDCGVVCTCGPHGMLEAVAHWAQRRALPCWVSVEEVFGCSVGLCGGCAIPALAPAGPYERFLWACREGAVVAAERIDWDAWRAMHA